MREIASNTDGAFIYQATYSAFGFIVSEVNPNTGDRYKFTGREFDAEFSQYYFRARYYDPNTGRFTGEDPAASDVNLYRNVGNGPTNVTDPLGLQGVPAAYSEAMAIYAAWDANRLEAFNRFYRALTPDAKTKLDDTMRQLGTPEAQAGYLWPLLRPFVERLGWERERHSPSPLALALLNSKPSYAIEEPPDIQVVKADQLPDPFAAGALGEREGEGDEVEAVVGQQLAGIPNNDVPAAEAGGNGFGQVLQASNLWRSNCRQ